jgi:hypothetical protein
MDLCATQAYGDWMVAACRRGTEGWAMALRCDCCCCCCCCRTCFRVLGVRCSDAVGQGVDCVRTCCDCVAHYRIAWTLRLERMAERRCLKCCCLCILLCLVGATRPECSQVVSNERRHMLLRRERWRKPFRRVSWCSRSS